MAKLILRLLGTPQVEVEGIPLRLTSRKCLALLAYLSTGELFAPRETLAALLWPELDRSRGHKALRQCLWHIKRSEAGVCLDVDKGIRLSTGERVWRDVLEFQQNLRAADSTQDDLQRLELLADAAALYRGRFLEGFTLPDSQAFDEWQLFQAESFEVEVNRACQRLVAGLSERGQYERALSVAREWQARDPYAESVHRRILELLCWTDRRSQAIQLFRRFKERLSDELDIVPEPETTALYEDLLQGRIPVPLQPTPPRQPVNAQDNDRLPMASIEKGRLLSGFFVRPLLGRERELSELFQQILNPACRLLVLTGIGGVGKTRLAIRVAEGVADQFEEGCLFVPLRDAATEGDLIAAVAARLGCPLEGVIDPDEQLIESLRGREVLLLLDNFEQLVESAGFLHRLLRECPRLKLLLTSLQPLHIEAEWLFEVRGLSVPSQATSEELARSDAVKLFISCTRRTNHRFSIGDDEEERRHLMRICCDVAGLPLALEMVAAWAGVLSLAEISREVRRDRELVLESRSLPERHRSLNAVLEASWNLLSQEERTAIEKLSVFQRTFTRPAANAVAGVDLRTLMALRDKSLLQPREEGRYEIHPLIQRYAVSRLEAKPSELIEPKERFLRYYIRYLKRCADELIGPLQLRTLESMESEMSNIQAAWDQAVREVDRKAIDEGLDGLFRYYRVRGSYLQASRNLLAAYQALGPQADRPLSVRVAVRLGRIYILQGKIAEASETLTSALGLLRSCGPKAELALGLSYLGVVEIERGAFARAEEVLREALELARSIADRFLEAGCLLKLGRLFGQTRSSKALAVLRQSLRIYTELGDRLGMEGCNNNIAAAYIDSKRFEEAISTLRRSLDASRELGHYRNVALSLGNLSLVLLNAGKLEEAKKTVLEGIHTCDRVGSVGPRPWCLMGLGCIFNAQGDIASAKATFREALELSRRHGLMTIALSALGHLAELMAANGKPQKAIELAAFIIGQPAADQDALSKAKRLQARAERSSIPDAARNARRRAPRQSLEDFIDEVLDDPFVSPPCDYGTLDTSIAESLSQ